MLFFKSYEQFLNEANVADVKNLDFSIFSDIVTYCLNEACGTFAYTMSNYFDDITILAVGNYTKSYTTSINRYTPNKIRYEHLNHIIISHNFKFYDVRGECDINEICDEFDSNGYSILSKEDLKNKMGNTDNKPLYFDVELYDTITKRLKLYFIK